MIYHFLIYIMLITILAYKFYNIFNKNKLHSYTYDFIIKCRERNTITTISLVASMLCLCYLIFCIKVTMDNINGLSYKGINIGLLDLLVPNKFNSLIEPLSNNIRANIFEFSYLNTARENLFSSFYSILFIFIGIYFYFINSRFVYIKKDGIVRLGKLYKWDANKLHRWEKIFGRDILNANVIDVNGRSMIISFIVDNDSKNTLETLIGTESFTDTFD
ncbi:hypothetical protein [Alkaliphilus sp. B6464]|uniref:hypothetical protein n=1 Tax=Alkaliphilus sp. B6464 TaxID=2731219 RepID=UPI001BA6A714|nr:hypothetical protein [Alkaliphilus sp. B6464]QUH20018.1 hypothetical protein HYG84_08955 [Alkaliphilus sp. B6464]